MASILVTGGAGFIGSHLCLRLLKMGKEVICLDNFYTGQEANLQACQEYSGFSVVRHDVCNPMHFDVDGIFHLACPASPVHYQANPIQTNKTSVLGTLNALTLATERKIPILFSSTSEVYGDPLVHPQSERYWGNVNCTGPRACYDEGKRCAETFCRDFYHSHQTNVKIARIFNTYGPNMAIDDGRVISNFITQALNGEPLTVYGDGQQTRAFCYVDDTVEALLRLWASECNTPVNIGNPSEMTTLALAEMILALTQSESTISYKSLPQDDPMRRLPNIEKAQRLLDWSPTVDLKTGLLKTITYFKEALREPIIL